MKNSLLMAVAAFVLMACDKMNGDLCIDKEKDTPISIQMAGVAELITRAAATSLGGTEDAPVVMGVFISGGSADKYNATNVAWMHNGGEKWVAQALTLYEGRGSTQQIYAYYPYVDGIIGTIEVIASEQKDYLVATSTDITSSVISLTMNHALAKIVLNATMGTEVEDENIVKIEVLDMYVSGRWDVSDNSWSDLSYLPDATLEMKGKELLVIPMLSCAKFSIVITTNTNRVFKTDISLASVDNKLEAGVQYNITLKVGKDKVNFGAISAAPWEGVLEDEVLETI